MCEVLIKAFEKGEKFDGWSEYFNFETWQEALKEDGGNHKIFPFTELNLVQISKKRVGKSIYEYMEEQCPLCLGSGALLKLSYLEGLINNEITRYHNENGINDFFIEVDEAYKDNIREDIVSFLNNIDGLIKKFILIMWVVLKDIGLNL